MPHDVIIVGAGPAGSAAAQTCAAQGLSTLCIEEHGTIGYPVQCAGLLSNAAFAECRITDRTVLNRVSGARVITSSGSECLIDAKVQKAVVVDRASVDREMAKAAADAGADYRLKTSVYRVKGNTVLTRGAYGHEKHTFKILIAADGPRSTIARHFGMERAKVYLSGIQADILHDCDPRFVEIYPDASPEFFAWSIPTAPGRIRVGLCGQTLVKEQFDTLMKTFQTSTTHLVTGTLPLGLMPRTYGHKTLFVGDAAGFAKPTSGGGVYTGIRSGRHAALTAIKCCERGTFDDKALAEYEQRWQADFGRELDLGFRLFGVRQKLHKEELEMIVQAIKEPSILAAIVEHGDMDRPGKLIKNLLLNPAMIPLLKPLILSGIRSFF
ncbi:MAG: NAD(P)/FAD-dependent oxidoreductase [Methanoregula sp.]|nr:NAD(P)/FAD-dependent oxidoreductase [Methanoregula sp.]